MTGICVISARLASDAEDANDGNLRTCLPDFLDFNPPRPTFTKPVHHYALRSQIWRDSFQLS